MTQRICEADGCEGRHQARGMCSLHYRRWWLQNGTFRACTFGGCDGRAESRGLCGAHRYQRDVGKELSAVVVKRDVAMRDDQGRKQCGGCLLWLATGQFYQNRGGRDGLQPSCKRCHRDRDMRRWYGMSLAAFEEMSAAQHGRCAICLNEQAGGQPLAVDHDHACCPGRESCGRCVRGLLCDPCNVGIGYLGDDSWRLAQAAEYIRSRQKAAVHG